MIGIGRQRLDRINEWDAPSPASCRTSFSVSPLGFGLLSMMFLAKKAVETQHREMYRRTSPVRTFPEEAINVRGARSGFKYRQLFPRETRGFFNEPAQLYRFRRDDMKIIAPLHSLAEGTAAITWKARSPLREPSTQIPKKSRHQSEHRRRWTTT